MWCLAWRLSWSYEYGMNATVSTSPLLIDAGPSRAGASYYGEALRCLQHFAYRHRMQPRGLLTAPQANSLGSASALIMGSLVHTALAHHLVRSELTRPDRLPSVLVGTSNGHHWVSDPDAVLPPHEAVREWVTRNGTGHEFIEQVDAVYFNYARFHPILRAHVAAVETEMVAVLGMAETSVGPTWDVWVLEDDQPRTPDGLTFEAKGGGVVRAEPLDCPGHVNHGKPIFVTRRADLITLDPVAKMRAAIVDHKTTSSQSLAALAPAYAADLGFGLFWRMGQQAFHPDVGWLGAQGFRGVFINILQKREPFGVRVAKVPCTPARNQNLARDIFTIMHRIASLDVATEAGDMSYKDWPKASSEMVCTHRYGPCGGYDLCFNS